MKKYYGYIILAGIISAAIFKDPCFGSFFGILVAVVIGIPLFLFIHWFFKIFVKGNAVTIDLMALLLSVIVIIGIFWFLFQPPGWLVFRMHLSSPPPPSVKRIHSRWRTGIFDVPIHIKFEIERSDLDKIIVDKKYKKHILDRSEKENLLKNEFNIKNIDEIEAYILETGGYEDETLDYLLSEIIIYNPNTKQAFYSHFFST